MPQKEEQQIIPQQELELRTKTVKRSPGSPKILSLVFTDWSAQAVQSALTWSGNQGFGCSESLPLHHRGNVGVLDRRGYGTWLYSFATWML